MKNIKKTILAISAVTCVSLCSAQADTGFGDDFELVSKPVHYSVKDGLVDPCNNDPAFKANMKLQDEQAEARRNYENSWTKYGVDTAKSVGWAALGLVYEGAKFSTAYVASASLGTVAIDLGADIFAIAAAPVLGPVAPALAGVIKGANHASEFIPGINSLKHVCIGYMTKDLVLPGMLWAAGTALKHGPAVVKGSVSALGSVYSYFSRP